MLFQKRTKFSNLYLVSLHYLWAFQRSCSIVCLLATCISCLIFFFSFYRIFIKMMSSLNTWDRWLWGGYSEMGWVVDLLIETHRHLINASTNPFAPRGNAVCCHPREGLSLPTIIHSRHLPSASPYFIYKDKNQSVFHFSFLLHFFGLKMNILKITVFKYWTEYQVWESEGYGNLLCEEGIMGFWTSGRFVVGLTASSFR